MMFILQKRSSFVSLLFLLILLSSCQALLPVEPVSDYNDRFKAVYGGSVNKAKKKHYDSIKKSGYDGTVSFEKTALGRIKQQEQDFLEINARNNPYIEIENSGSNDVEYLSYNAGAYSEIEDNIFDDIKIPKNDFKYYNLGKKEYNEISNIELQESYDYMSEINRERFKQIEIARIKNEYKKGRQKENVSVIDKTKEGLRNLKNRISELLK